MSSENKKGGYKRYYLIRLVIFWVLFILYITTMVFLLFFFDREPRIEYRYNLEPFVEIKRYWSCLHPDGPYFKYALFNLFGNVALFIPYGFIIPIIFYKRNSFIWVFMSCLVFIGSIETIQLVTKLGAFDVDDIILNFIGGMIGYIIYVIVRYIYRRAIFLYIKEKKREMRDRNLAEKLK